MKKILIIGATSAIAEATARLWASENHAFYLVARNAERLEAIASDLLVRGAHTVHSHCLDLNNFQEHAAMLDQAFAVMQGMDVVLIAHGSLGDQAQCEQNFNQALSEINTNAVSVLSLLTHLANRLESQGSGVIAVLGSVAGDRGRASNYVYGASKAFLEAFCSGLRNRLFRRGVHVILIKPGIVATPMTANLTFPPGLMANVTQVAKAIQKGVAKQKNTVYTPRFWAWIMFGIRCLPTNCFKRLRL